MSAKQIVNVALVVVFSVFISVAAAGEEGQVYDMSALEGEWKVVSTTWGGDPADFEGVTYTLKINKDTIKTEDDITQFTITLNGGSGFVSGMNNLTFCAQRYSLLQNSYSFYYGYPRLMFWTADDYPCKEAEAAPDELEEDEKFLVINSSKELIRFDIVSPEKAHVVFYYEGTFYAAFIESRLSELEKEGNFDNSSPPKCSDGVCSTGVTAWTGIFEVELEKVK